MVEAFKRGRIEIRKENLILSMRMNVKKILWWKGQFLRGIKRFHDMVSNFLIDVVFVRCGWRLYHAVVEGGEVKKRSLIPKS